VEVVLALPALDADRVDLWPIDLDEPADDTTWSTLDEAERARAHRFRFDIHRDRFVVGRAMVRRLLGAYLEHDPASLVVRATAAGKPYLDGAGTDVRFNLSNAGGVGLLGVTLGREIGVDLEPLRDVDWGPDIARQFFSEHEIRSLFAFPERDRSLAFLRAWTRKEAVLKAKGDGLLAPLHDFDVTLDEQAHLLATRWDEADAARWQLHDASATMPGHVAAIAVEGECWFHCGAMTPQSTRSSEEKA
jgi:4'-phosphopantetheinyl transferase